MICPYNRKRESQVFQWTQKSDEESQESSCQQITLTDIIMQECPREGCAAWYDGRCHYYQGS